MKSKCCISALTRQFSRVSGGLHRALQVPGGRGAEAKSGVRGRGDGVLTPPSTSTRHVLDVCLLSTHHELTAGLTRDFGQVRLTSTRFYQLKVSLTMVCVLLAIVTANHGERHFELIEPRICRRKPRCTCADLSRGESCWWCRGVRRGA